MRLSTRFRYWMIKTLACGDLMVVNLHVSSAGQWASRNTGPSLIWNTVFEGQYDIGVLLAPGLSNPEMRGNAAISRRSEGRETYLFSGVRLGGSHVV